MSNSKLVIPYIDVSVNADWSDWQHYPKGRPNPIYSKQVIDYKLDGLILGFITLSSAHTACWAAQPTMGLDWAKPLADDLKAANKKVVVSFGGASNAEISTQFTVDQLVDTYTQVISLYNAFGLDFDLENGLYDADKIVQALTKLKTTNPNIQLSLTLPTMPTGLTDTGMGLVNKFAPLKVTVNGMAMDYYQQSTQMGKDAVSAATSIHQQLKQVYTDLSDAQVYQKVGVTPMIGLNDDLTNFKVSDATIVGDYVRIQNLNFVAFWDLNRDNPSSYSYVDLTSSSNNNQTTPGEYSRAFVAAVHQ
eukprot:gene5818-7239_t